MISGKVLVFIVVLGVALAYGPGQYVPKSFFVIDQYGHQSQPVFIRNRREIMDHPVFRVKRGGGSGGGYASASSYSSASASSGGGVGGGSGGGGGPIYHGGDYVPSFVFDPAGILNQVQNLINTIPAGAGATAGAHSFASSGSSASSGHGGVGPATGQSFGGLGAGHDAGYQGPVLFSRFGEAEGSGVHVSGQAQGNRGAFASSSSQIDDKGKIHYSVQSGKF